MSPQNRIIGKRYQLGKLVGSGGMASIYQAHDFHSGEKVAVKILNTDLAHNAKLVELFEQEARSAQTLSHPHIITTIDSGEELITDEDGKEVAVPFIVMEYVDGLELSRVIARGPLKISEAVRVTSELLEAVQFAHESGIIHRDIKPANVMIARNGDVKVVDFGIARAVAETYDDVDQTTSILGTAAYFSPEQAQGQKVDTKTDIYAIGIVLYEMLTGKPPFSGDTAVAVAHQHIHAVPVPPSELNPKVSPELDAVVLKALAKKKTQRFANTQSFATTLEEAAQAVPQVKEAPAVVETAAAILLPAATPSNDELPDEFSFLFGSDPSTAPVYVQPESFKPERKRVVALVAVIALISLILTGIGLWVTTIKPVNFFPSQSVTMPKVAGESLSTVKNELLDAGLVPTVVLESSGTIAKDKVIRTDPPKGSVVEPGSAVTIFVSQGKVKAPIPDVKDLSVEEATAQLKEAGFVVGTVTQAHSANVAEGRVTATTPASGTEALQGTKINLAVSDGKIEIPEMRGQSVADANAALAALMLYPVVQADTGCAKGDTPTVNSQSVSPGVVPQGTKITITYCAG